MSVELFGCTPGPTNALMDVPGLGVGHAIYEGGQGDSGVSVIVAPGGAVASVDVRGGGPGTRETDLLPPENTVGAIHAVALCGGSAFGLDATSGAMRQLEEEGIGFPVLGEIDPDKRIPIVPGAVIFDLLLGRWDSRPDADTGAEATAAALRALQDRQAADKAEHQEASVATEATNQGLAMGNVGAGLGASAGALKGGFGQASAVFPNGTPLAGVTVAAAVVVNPQGAIFDPATGLPWGLAAELDGEFGVLDQLREQGVPEDVREKLRTMNLFGTKIPAEMVGVSPDLPRLNTTIGVVATDAPITKAQAKRLALASHDGLARAIRPAHMPMDGDTLFGLSTAVDPATGTTPRGAQPVDPIAMSMLSAVGANCVERAIVHAVLAADTAYDTPSYCQVTGVASQSQSEK